ncbi:hypothetical protein [Myxococcus sp. RHSTA-1-4]|uniref:hypothetical protein n=1 Tax=Myxococcus sp. RHSTA-1-4 TaxID=2874601 RepID=UPI001CBF3E9B|nr:hypothetical protein [Myxococcus sp. RHSTA-1-4]MBZ4419192.1 hypothetical protein [Myxococcus sp. RHSTA-1-4]
MPGERSTSGRDMALRPRAARAGTAFPVGGSFLVVFLFLLPAEVLACPACAVRAPESPVRSVLLLGGLVLAPFLLVGLGIWAVRRAAREERQ